MLFEINVERKAEKNGYTEKKNFCETSLNDALEIAILYSISQKNIVNVIDHQTGEIVYGYNGLSKCTMSVMACEYLARVLADNNA